MSTEARFMNIVLEDLQPNEYNARRFEENMTPQRMARFQELVASVTEKGIIEPLLVRPIGDGRYEVIAGERRYRAAREAADRFGSSTGYVVPCMVREVGDDEAFDLMVVENLQREDLTPLETARAFQVYLSRHGNTPDAMAEISARTGVPVHAIRRQVRLLELPDEVLRAWRDGEITQSHMELLTRLENAEQVVELMETCRRSKLSVRELGERIGTICPELERGFFEKTECQVCHHNTAVQSGLFPDAAPGGAKCGNPGCFEAKQSTFLSENWATSKAAAKFSTRGFRFGHRLQEYAEMLAGKETVQRCLDCDAFVSILRLNGTVVSGYDRACVGSRKCFEELYCTPSVAPPNPEPEKSGEEREPAARTGEQAQPAGKVGSSETKSDKAKVATNPAANTSATTPETGPVYNGPRGEKAREEYYRAHLPERIQETEVNDRRVFFLGLLTLVLSSAAAKAAFVAHVQMDDGDPAKIAHLVLNDMLFEEDLHPAMQACVIARLMEGNVSEKVRRVVSESLGIHLSDWSPTKDYLDSLTKSELIRVCEEPGVAIWSDDKVKARRKERFKGRALMTLKSEQLVDLVLNSGADLKGRVPAEVLGKR